MTQLKNEWSVYIMINLAHECVNKYISIDTLENDVVLIELIKPLD